MNRKQMKMLLKEGAQINLSFGVVLDLLECHFGHRRELFHDQICNQLDCYRGIYSLSASHSHSVNLKIILSLFSTPVKILLKGYCLWITSELCFYGITTVINSKKTEIQGVYS